MSGSQRLLCGAIVLVMTAACTQSTDRPGGATANAPGASAQAPGAPGASGPNAERVTPAPGSPPASAAATGAAAVAATPTGATKAAPNGSSAGAATTTGAPAAAAPPAPVVREVVIPVGAEISVRLDEPVASDTHTAGAKVAALLDKPLVVDGLTVAEAGSPVEGRVTAAQRSGRVKGRAELSITFDALTPAGTTDRYAIRTGSLSRQAAGTGKKDALKVGVPAVGGAIIGGIIGGKKGAVIGGTVGGGAGAAVVLSTRGEEVRLPKGRLIELELKEPVTVRVTVPPGK